MCNNVHDFALARKMKGKGIIFTAKNIFLDEVGFTLWFPIWFCVRKQCCKQNVFPLLFHLRGFFFPPPLIVMSNFRYSQMSLGTK